jgi:hypothetical protein
MSKNTSKIGRADFLKSYLFELLEGAYSAFPDELTEFAEKFPELSSCRIRKNCRQTDHNSAAPRGNGRYRSCSARNG